MNEKSAMQMTAVYACVRILSETIAGLSLHLFDGAVAAVMALDRSYYMRKRKQRICVGILNLNIDDCAFSSYLYKILVMYGS